MKSECGVRPQEEAEVIVNMNKAKSLRNILITFTLLTAGVYSQSVPSQPARVAEPARLVESITTFQGDYSSMIIDVFRIEVFNHKDSKGYIIVYCGKSCRYGEVEAHLRGIELSLRFKGVAANTFKVMAGGYKEKTTTEFWLVPANGCPPPLDSSVNIRDVKFRSKSKKTVVDYECCF